MIKTPIFQLGREDYRRGEARPSHYPARASGWDFEHRHDGGMTKAQAKRRLEIIQLLSDMSKDSWKNARPEDYLPLEQELRRIERRAGVRS